MWTVFFDCYGGGNQKTPYEYIYIESSSEDSAIKIFEKRFRRGPYEISCECCGEDFDVSSHKDLEKLLSADASHQGVRKFSEREDVLIIPRKKRRRKTT